MTISITDEKGGLRLQNIPMGSTIRVHAKYARFRPNGTYIFYLKPSTGGYKNVMIHTGEYGGANELSGTYSSFYIPTLGQMAGKVEIFVYIPGRGVGVVTTTIVYPKQ